MQQTNKTGKESCKDLDKFKFTLGCGLDIPTLSLAGRSESVSLTFRKEV